MKTWTNLDKNLDILRLKLIPLELNLDIFADNI